MNFYECCDLTKKLYQKSFFPHQTLGNFEAIIDRMFGADFTLRKYINFGSYMHATADGYFVMLKIGNYTK